MIPKFDLMTQTVTAPVKKLNASWAASWPYAAEEDPAETRKQAVLELKEELKKVTERASSLDSLNLKFLDGLAEEFLIRDEQLLLEKKIETTENSRTATEIFAEVMSAEIAMEIDQEITKSIIERINSTRVETATKLEDLEKIKSTIVDFEVHQTVLGHLLESPKLQIFVPESSSLQPYSNALEYLMEDKKWK